MLLRIKAERLRRGWSQTVLGARAGLAASDISRIETGRFKPYPLQVARLSRALNVPADRLLDPADDHGHSAA
jgi:transcriptional regulator with XRE-family HTH domain